MHPNRLVPALIGALALTLLGAPDASAQGAGVWGPASPLVAPVADVPIARRDVRGLLRSQLAERRAINLARFIAYREAGAFPRNHVRRGALNVFIDDEGHICAAANLMARDGLMGLVRATAARNNFLRLADVHDGALYEWMLSSGFTQEEIATIQEPYMYIEPEIPEEPMFEELEKERLQARFRQIEAELRRQTDASLETAVSRLMAYRSNHGVPVDAPVSADGRYSNPPIQPVTRPVVRPVIRPVVRPVGPVTRPVVRPVVRPVTRPVVQPVVQPVTVRVTVRDPLVWQPSAN